MNRIVIELSGGVVQEVYADEPSSHVIYDYDDLSDTQGSAAQQEIGEQLEDGRLYRSVQFRPGDSELEHIVGNMLADLPSALFTDDAQDEVHGSDLVDLMTDYARRLQAAYERRDKQ